MTVIKYNWLCWDSARPSIERIKYQFLCFISVNRAMGYVRIECKKEDVETIKNILKNC